MVNKILLTILISTIFLPTFAQAAPDWVLPQPQTKFAQQIQFSTPEKCGTDQAGKDLYCVTWIGQMVAHIYNYAVGVVGIIAAIVLMFGGIMWLTAGGSADKVSTAKSLIGASLTGLVLTMTSYAILFQINPNLTDMEHGIKVAIIDPVVTGCGVIDGHAIDGITESSFEKKTGELKGKWTVNTKAYTDPVSEADSCLTEQAIKDIQICCIVKTAMDVNCNSVSPDKCPNTPAGAGGQLVIESKPGDCSQYIEDCRYTDDCAGKPDHTPCNTETASNDECFSQVCTTCRTENQGCDSSMNSYCCNGLQCVAGSCVKSTIDCTIPSNAGKNCDVGKMCDRGRCLACKTTIGDRCGGIMDNCCTYLGFFCENLSWEWDKCNINLDSAIFQ